MCVLILIADSHICIQCFKLLADSTAVHAVESEELLHKSVSDSKILYLLKLLHPLCFDLLSKKRYNVYCVGNLVNHVRSKAFLRQVVVVSLSMVFHQIERVWHYYFQKS